MVEHWDIFESAGRTLAKYALDNEGVSPAGLAGGAALAGGGYLGYGALKSRQARKKAQQEAAAAAAASAAKKARRVGAAKGVAKGLGVAGGVALGALGLRRGAQAARAGLAKGRNAKLVSAAKSTALKHRVANIPDASWGGALMGSGPFKPTTFKKKVNLKPLDDIAFIAPNMPSSRIRKFGQASASNRMSQALAGVRTKSGAIGGPGSVGRIPGAPAVTAPSVQGVPKANSMNPPSLGFPKISKPPRV